MFFLVLCMLQLQNIFGFFFSIVRNARVITLGVLTPGGVFKRLFKAVDGVRLQRLQRPDRLCKYTRQPCM